MWSVAVWTKSGRVVTGHDFGRPGTWSETVADSQPWPDSEASTIFAALRHRHPGATGS